MRLTGDVVVVLVCSQLDLYCSMFNGPGPPTRRTEMSYHLGGLSNLVSKIINPPNGFFEFHVRGSVQAKWHYP